MNENINIFTNIERFLQGQLPAEGYSTFFQSLQNRPELQQQLYEESSFEAAFYSEQWLESASSIKDKIGDWYYTIAPFSTIEKEQTSEVKNPSVDKRLTHNKWQKIIDKAFDSAQKRDVKPAFILPFFNSNVRKVTTVISLILIASAAIFLTLRNTTPTQRFSDKLQTTDTYRDKSKNDYTTDTEFNNN